MGLPYESAWSVLAFTLQCPSVEHCDVAERLPYLHLPTLASPTPAPHLTPRRAVQVRLPQKGQGEEGVEPVPHQRRRPDLHPQHEPGARGLLGAARDGPRGYGGTVPAMQ